MYSKFNSLLLKLAIEFVDYLLKMVIFHSYLSLPEGIGNSYYLYFFHISFGFLRRLQDQQTEFADDWEKIRDIYQTWRNYNIILGWKKQ